MNRRAAVRTALGSALVAAALTVPAAVGVAVGVAVGPSVAAAPGGAASVVAVPGVPDPPPPVTVNEFLPEEQNLGDCLGALERPGCGSEARGGWRQTAVFAVMAVGLVIVFGRVGLAVFRNRR